MPGGGRGARGRGGLGTPQKPGLPFIELTSAPWRRYSLALEQACELNYHGSLERRGWGAAEGSSSELWPEGREDKTEHPRERMASGQPQVR